MSMLEDKHVVTMDVTVQKEGAPNQPPVAEAHFIWRDASYGAVLGLEEATVVKSMQHLISGGRNLLDKAEQGK